ncbi:hypothetical protein M0R45_017025 [Rubus argutus]|uniref:Uncharacterized protein n=1 Tax=Rubus argutus TaxID=59490 RepID=A0AAW1XUR7_RUBAR
MNTNHSSLTKSQPQTRPITAMTASARHCTALPRSRHPPALCHEHQPVVDAPSAQAVTTSQTHESSPHPFTKPVLITDPRRAQPSSSAAAAVEPEFDPCPVHKAPPCALLVAVD